MKQMIKIVALTTSLLSSVVFAQSDMYFGVGMHQSKLSDTRSISGTSYTVKYKENSYRALIGKRLNDNMAVELQYVDLSKGSVKINGVTNSNFSGDSLGIAGLYYFVPQADYLPFVKLGFHSWNSKQEFGTRSVKDDGTDVLYGVGVDGKINETMKYRVEFERLEGKHSDIDNIGVALLVDF